MDGRVKPGQDGRGSEASRRQPTDSYRYKSRLFHRVLQNSACSQAAFNDGPFIGD